MDIIIKTGFERISHSINFQPETETKGQKVAKASHVRNVEEYRRNGESYLIQAQIIRQTSVNETPYKTQLFVDNTRKVIDVSCTCAYNKSKKCKHVAALIYYINNTESLSKTDFEAQWGKPSARQFAQEKYSKGKYFCEMFPSPTKAAIQSFKIDVQLLKQPSALKIIMLESMKNKEERTLRNEINAEKKKLNEITQKKTCEEIVKAVLPLTDKYPVYSITQEVPKNVIDFYSSTIVISVDEIISLCCDTVSQSSSDKWFEARRMRVSASKNAHDIKSRVTRTIDSLIGIMLHTKKIDNASTRYGIKNEAIARREYEILNGVEVMNVGLLVSRHQPWLCASLDGVVIKNNSIIKIVEIKCPSTCEKLSVIDNEAQKCNVNYLSFINGELTLKKSHVYYTQCQIQMYVS